MRRAGCLLCLIGLVAWPPLAHAVIVYDGDGTQNVADFATTDPRNRVGIVGTSLSGVYLGSVGGQGWVLTANHVGAGNFTLYKKEYSAVADSAVRLTNTDGSAADLLLYRIDTSLNWPLLSLSGSSLSTGTAVTMIGNGYNRSADLMTWYVDGTSWSTVPSAARTKTGYLYSSPLSRTLRWGTNTVDHDSSLLSFNNTICAATTFDAAPGDAQAASGDSGGGVFSQGSDGSWSLVGTMVAIGYTAPDRALVGDVTLIADLSAYRSQILTTIPEPATVPVLLGLATLGFVVVRRLRRRR